MIKFTISLGLKDKDTKKQKISTRKAKRKLNKLLFTNGLDATIYTAKGLYTHANGKRVKENTLRIDLYFTTDEKVFNFCQKLKIEYNQESVALEKVAVNSDLI